MKYLFDTAPWLNLAQLPEVVPPRIRALVQGEAPVGLCSVSLLESAILLRSRRLLISGSLAEFFTAALARDVELLELTPAIAVLTNELPADFQGDPFDRTITATARAFNLVLITADSKIRDAGFCEVEYYPFKPSRANR